MLAVRKSIPLFVELNVFLFLLLRIKVLPLGKIQINLVFLSLNRTFAENTKGKNGT